MIWKNSKDEFGLIARLFHWIMAALVIFMLALGLYMEDLKFGPETVRIFLLHKSLGVLVLMLVFLRLLWRFANVVPQALETHRPWERVLAKATHWLLYVLIVAMPLSGWIMSSAKGRAVEFFGLFTLPDLVAEDKGIGRFAAEFHEITATALMIAIGLHVAGVLKHLVLDRDATFKRMTSGLARTGKAGGEA